MPLGLVVAAVLDDEVWLRLGLLYKKFSFLYVFKSSCLLTMFDYASKVFLKQWIYYSLSMGS
jgi:hypothetical protein